MKFYTLALCAALGAASQAQAAGLFSRSGADERVKSGWELGAGIGMHTHEESIEDQVVFDGQGTAYKLFAGYRFNRYFAAELAYVDGGDPAESYVDGTTGEPLERVEVQAHGFQASVLGALPLGQSAFSLFGRLGYLDSKTDVRVVDQTPAGVFSPPQTFTSNSEDPFFGIGLMAALDGALLRLEYEYVDFDVDDLVDTTTGDTFEAGSKSSILSLSVLWVF
jgi:OmpA-OmpF porin, OOP family